MGEGRGGETRPGLRGPEVGEKVEEAAVRVVELLCGRPVSP